MKWDVVTPIDKEGSKTRWHKIGRAWSDNEKRICVMLNSLPFRSEYVYLMETDAGITKPQKEPK